MPAHVVIIGAGFGGLRAAKALARAPVRVTMIDARNFHLFQPLLYQAATGALSPAEISYPIRTILRRQRNAQVFMQEALAVDPAARKVILRRGEIAYDFLIVATGARHSYFGHDDWERWAPGLKTIEDAQQIRRRILLALEQAEMEADPARRQALLTFAVVGAGPTGVELAGAIAEIARHVMAKDFRAFDPRDARVLLVEAGPRVLSAFPEELAAKAEEALAGLGVEILKNAPVTELDGGSITCGGRAIAAATVLWAAGVTASPLGRSLGAPLDRAGRVLVEPDLSVPGHPEVFVIGDLAAFTHQGGAPLPGVAPVAMQQGDHAARNIRLSLECRPRQPFRYVNKGNLATIGRNHAVADFGFLRLSGFVAWAAWLLVHIVYLVGFRNRFVAIFNWAVAYLTYRRASLLIIGGAAEDGAARN
jgi:NADH dehydrogenase